MFLDLLVVCCVYDICFLCFAVMFTCNVSLKSAIQMQCITVVTILGLEYVIICEFRAARGLIPVQKVQNNN